MPAKRKYEDATDLHEAADVIKSAFKRSKSVAVRSVTPAVRKYVRKAVRGEGELKVTSDPWATNPFTLGLVNSANMPTVVYCTPLITAGTSQGQRVGAKVRPVKLVVQGTLSRLSTQATASPFFVKAVVCKLKLTTIAPVQADLNAMMYGTGGASVGPSTLAMETMDYPWNTDNFTIVWERMFKIGQASSATIPYTNNDFQNSFRFKVDLSRAVKKTWHYVSGNNYPQNDGLYLMFLPWTYDESALVSSPTVPITAAGVSTVWYRDD